jgi:hypothetical protein
VFEIRNQELIKELLECSIQTPVADILAASRKDTEILVADFKRWNLGEGAVYVNRDEKGSITSLYASRLDKGEIEFLKEADFRPR